MIKELTEKRLEANLDHPDIGIRLHALSQLKERANKNKIIIAPKNQFMNLHCHSFHSYNAYGYSPSRIVWLGYKNGYDMMGLVDFDVLDGMEEFLRAGAILNNYKTVVGIESRVFISDYADKEINSPKEPGVCYFCGIGFTSYPSPGSDAAAILKKIFQIARQRNLSILGKLNPLLSPITLDYEKDVLPLTVSGNATERHIIKAYYRQSQSKIKNTPELAAFWSDKLKTPEKNLADLFRDEYNLFELMRSKLIKHGSIGYVKPEPANFPALDEMIKMIRESNALPSIAYLDGTSAAESDIYSFLKYFKDKGVELVTAIPDRNWNIADPKEKKIKTKNFSKFMSAVRDLKLNVIAGTELNKAGQKFIDDFETPALKPYQDDFIRGAQFVYKFTQKAGRK